MTALERLRDRLRGTWMEGLIDSTGHLCYIIPDSDSTEPWRYFCDLQNDLLLYGWKLTGRVTINSSYISGYIDEV
jgi:hypothetical protein